MKIAVQTSLPAFQNDIGDVVRLFYGEGAAVEETQQADDSADSMRKQTGNGAKPSF